MEKSLRLAYRVVDVFTRVPLEGNPLAVFHGGELLEDRLMQRIARELNLAETAFVVPPKSGGHLGVRIFTPTREMRFAGHPTIGTAYVARALGLVPAHARTIVLEEQVGPVAVHFEEDCGGKIWLETPQITWGDTVDRAACARALGIAESDMLDVPIRCVSAGNAHAYVALASIEAVDRMEIARAGLRHLFAAQNEPMGVFVFAPTPAGAHSRMFSEEHGVVEDPATGSATGPLAAFMMAYGLVSNAGGTTFVSEQGTKMGRRSLLHVRIRGERGADGIDVGGEVEPVAEAVMELREC